MPRIKKEPKLEPVVEAQAEALVEERLVLKEEEPVSEQVFEPVKDADYLRQYQYKNVENQPTVGGVLTDPDPNSKADRMKKNLLSQPRVNTFIPRAEGESNLVKFSVNLNGYRLDLPKNDLIEVPLQVAELIGECLKQQASALLPFQIGRDKANKDALS